MALISVSLVEPEFSPKAVEFIAMALECYDTMLATLEIHGTKITIVGNLKLPARTEFSKDAIENGRASKLLMTFIQNMLDDAQDEDKDFDKVSSLRDLKVHLKTRREWITKHSVGDLAHAFRNIKGIDKVLDFLKYKVAAVNPALPD